MTVEIRDESAKPRPFMLDTESFSKLADSYEHVELLGELARESKIDLVITRVQLGEMALTSDPAQLARRELMLESVPVRRIPVGGALYDRGAIYDDEDTNYSPDELDAMRPTRNIKDDEDALIGATAVVAGCTLVTNDGDFSTRAEGAAIDVWTIEELLDYLEQL